MFYSSGTTGQPKGILPPLPTGDARRASRSSRMMLTGLFGFDADTVYLQPGARSTTPPRRAGRTARSASAAPPS